MQELPYFLGSVILLIAVIVALIIVMVLRDQRELKTKQMMNTDLPQLEDLIVELKKVRDELAPTLVSIKKQEAALSQSLSQLEGRMKQPGPVSASNYEHRQQPAGSGGAPAAIREKQDEKRDRERGPRQGKGGRPWGGSHPDHRREYSGNPSTAEKSDVLAINDGEKYAKVSEMAKNGLTTQEIAKKLNVGAEEVSMVLELKEKK
jgi:hypothetical protein